MWLIKLSWIFSKNTEIIFYSCSLKKKILKILKFFSKLLDYWKLCVFSHYLIKLSNTEQYLFLGKTQKQKQIKMKRNLFLKKYWKFYSLYKKAIFSNLTINIWVSLGFDNKWTYVVLLYMVRNTYKFNPRCP